MRPALKLAPAPTSANAKRHRRVFAIRLEPGDRELLERAAAVAFPAFGRPLGRFIRRAIREACAQVLGGRR
jgi:uncharacterized protein (DUF1778 family)